MSPAASIYDWNTEERKVCAMNTGSDFTCERLETQADFDMIGFMELSKETELSGPVMDRIVELWDRWFQMLYV